MDLMCAANIPILGAFSTFNLVYGKGLLVTLGPTLAILSFLTLRLISTWNFNPQKMLNPVFSIPHMRQMSQDVYYSLKDVISSPFIL
jgi:hypothetical protein